MNRRDFLRSLAVTALPLLLPQFAKAAVSSGQKRRISVLVELKGANDGLNTLIPYTSSVYYTARPNIAIQASNVLKLSGQLGLHPALAALKSSWDQGEMAWIQGLGYENQNRSHFESIEIWDNANQQLRGDQDGWVAQCFPEHALGGVAIDTNLGPLFGEKCSALSITDPIYFVNMGKNIDALKSSSNNPALQHILSVQANIDILANSLDQYLHNVPAPQTAFPKTQFGRNLNSVYTLIASGLEVPAYKVSLGSFDTHTGQPNTQQNLLKQLADGLALLRSNLQYLGMWDEVLVMTYSEFGRRLKENANRGTDHGAAAPHLVIGGKVRGGFYGEYPSLTELDSRGDLMYTTDFRRYYETIQQNWWGLAGSGYTPMNFV